MYYWHQMKREQGNALPKHWEQFGVLHPVVTSDRCAHPVWQHCVMSLECSIFFCLCSGSGMVLIGAGIGVPHTFGHFTFNFVCCLCFKNQH